MRDFSRRDAIGTAALAGAGLIGASAVAAQSGATEAGGTPVSPPPAFSGLHKSVPLSFDPAKLEGLSERLISSHWQNNYIGSVKALNMVEGRLAAAATDQNMPAVIYGGLKREQLHRTGSVILHELYFGALGGDGIAAGSIRDDLAVSHGSFEAWEAEFRRTAMSLAGGSGWSILAFNLHSGSLHTYWAWDHMHQAASSIPLITLDMYEHSYHMDYGTAAAKYVAAFMRNLDWEVIDARYQKVKSLKLG